MKGKNLPFDPIAKALEEGPAELREHILRNQAEAERLLTPLLEQLQSEGFEMISVDDLRGLEMDRQKYRKALPILLRFLESVNHLRGKEIVVSLLKNKWAKPEAAQVLITEFKKAPPVGPRITWEMVKTRIANKVAAIPSSSLQWDIADALTYVATTEFLDEIISLFEDRKYGRGREMLALVLANIGKGNEKVGRVLMTALSDDDVYGFAIVALGKLKVKDATPQIAAFLNHKESSIRTNAKRALKRIGGS